MKPVQRPQRPEFSSGPCVKRQGWHVSCLSNAACGRSHRSSIGRKKIADVIEKTSEILSIPKEYRIGIVPASDTGAVEMAMWSLLGALPVDILAWESFGQGWMTDIIKQLTLTNVRQYKAAYGKLPDLTQVNKDHDVVFTWNGTTSGVCVPNGDWICSDRSGLTICDATSAAFAMDLPWEKLDATTWSWQKVMGGEAAHGMLVLSPRAVERLQTYTPPWPLPKIFRLTKGGKLIEGIFKGETINTPSMLAVEDHLDGLRWADEIGGLPVLKQRAETNLKLVQDWVAQSDWVGFLAEDPQTLSVTSICLVIKDPWFLEKNAEDQAVIAQKLVKLLADETVAYDIGSYRDAPPGLRLWGGATVENDDMAALLPWLDWGYAQIKQQMT